MKKIKEYLSPAIITVFIFIIVFAILGIAPFGEKSVFHYDMALASYPSLTLLWDVLHGDTDWLYNFNIGGGENAYVAISKSPINWLVALGKRENILMTGSWLVVLKFALLSITTYYSLKYFFPKLEKKWILFASLLNTFSGFSLLYYVIFDWIELWAVFPLIMVGFKKILDGESGILYTVTVTLCLLINIQVAYYIMFFLIFATLIMLILYVKKENRIKTAIKIFLNTVVALLISFISFYPIFIFSAKSYRISDADEVVSRVNNIAFKLLHILTSPILIFYSIQMVKNYKNDKKATKILIAFMILLLLPIIVEPFNRLWHTGSYSGMPYRFAFILIFIAICGMLRYIQTRKPEPKKEQNAKGVKIVKVILILFMIGNFAFNIYAINKAWEYQYIVGEVKNDEQLQYYNNVAISVIAGVLILLCSQEVQEQKFRNFMLVGVFIINTIFLMFLYIKNFECFAMIDSEDSIYLSQKLYDDFYEENEYKVKDDTELLMYNYPYIMKMNSIQNWFHIIPKRQVLAIQKMGYANNSVIQKDVGGTIISDLVVGVNRIISKDKDEEIYKELKSRNDIKYYTYNFKELPLCKVYSGEDLNKVTNYLEEDFEIKDVFGVQNELYNIFLNRNNNQEQIITVQKERKEENIEKKDGKYNVAEDSKITYEVELDSKSNLYLYSYELEGYVLLIQIYKDSDRKEKIYENELPYPDELHNGILDLGTYNEEKLYIDISFVYDDRNDELNSIERSNKKEESTDKDDNKEGIFKEIELGILNVEQFLKDINDNEFVNSNLKTNDHTFEITVENAEKGQYLMIPINYDDDWKAKNNGEEIEILPALGTYMSVELEEGENQIYFEFFPEDLKIGANVTFITSIVYVIMLIICKKSKIKF